VEQPQAAEVRPRAVVRPRVVRPQAVVPRLLVRLVVL